MTNIVALPSRSSRWNTCKSQNGEFYLVPLKEAESLRDWLRGTEFDSGVGLLNQALLNADKFQYNVALIVQERWDYYSRLRAKGITRFEDLARC